MKRYLVTTADENTWPKEESIIFLGEWCKRYSRMSMWENLNADIEPYHWDDRTKLYTDYLYLQGLYEKLLADMAYKLNQIHSVEHSLHYWRILIGPWLNYFTHMLFDRWYMLKQVIEKGKVDSCMIYERPPETLIPIDMDDFNQLFIEDAWNEMIYGQLITVLWSNELLVEKIPIKQEDDSYYRESNNTYRNGWKKFLKKMTFSTIYNLSKLKARDDDYFLISSSLPLKTEFQLQYKLGQFPKKWLSIPYSIIKKPCIQKRDWKLSVGELGDSFSKIASQMIPKHIPIAYLEGYGELVKKVDGVSWPKSPKLVFTSNAYSADDLFKCWAAKKVENGAQLIIGQHGGNFGMTPMASQEEHQITIADKWVSWGWSDTKRKKIIPIGNSKASTSKVKNNPEGHALMVCMTLPRYSYYLYCVPIAGQWMQYFDDQKRFLKALPNDLCEKVLLRTYHKDYGWDQLDRWKNDMPNIRIDHGDSSFYKMLSDSRIFIGTYNATTYLEALSLNIPTIVFWDQNYWEIKDQVKPIFLHLKKVKILHETPEKAAQHLVEIWGDIDQWWSRKEVQIARKKFCDTFSYTNDHLMQDYENLFKRLE